MKQKSHTWTRRRAIVIISAIFILMLMLMPLSIPAISAAVTELNVNPEVINHPGDVITVSGKASPNEEVWLSSSFELSLPISDGKYSREFVGIHFPEGEKEFSVRAENVKTLQVSVPDAIAGMTATFICDGETIKVTASKGFLSITIREEPLKRENDVIAFSFSLPIASLGGRDIAGEKDVKIEGDAADGATSVDLKVATSIKVSADSNGDFLLDINTEGVPEGVFLISAGEKEKTVYIGVTPTPTPSPTPSPSPSPSPTPSITPSPSPSISPSPTPTSSSTPTSTPIVTPPPPSTPTPTITPSQTPSPTTSPVITPSSLPSPSQTPTPSQRRILPGFEAVFAIGGLLAIAYLVLRRKK